MDVIFKLPPNKKPFIGVLFQAGDMKANLLNQDLVNDYEDVAFKASLYLGKKLTLTIRSLDQTIQPREYVINLYADKLSYFLAKTKKIEAYNFGHVRELFGRHELALTAGKRKNFVIPLDSFTVEAYGILET